MTSDSLVSTFQELGSQMYTTMSAFMYGRELNPGFHARQAFYQPRQIPRQKEVVLMELGYDKTSLGAHTSLV